MHIGRGGNSLRQVQTKTKFKDNLYYMDYIFLPNGYSTKLKWETNYRSDENK